MGIRYMEFNVLMVNRVIGYLCSTYGKYVHGNK